MPDTPQSINTPYSSLSHTLTAILHSSDSSVPSLSKSLAVHTKRYTPHSHPLPPSPETHYLDDPTRIQVEVPRTTFVAGEAIPLYVTVPPPRRELVVDQGLRLRNVRAELVRVVKVKRDEDEDETSDFEADLHSDNEGNTEEHLSVDEGPSTATLSTPDKPLSSAKSPLFLGSSFRAIIARSGASCRFHASRPVQLRFVLHQPSTTAGSPSDFQVDLPPGEYGHLDSDAECASITQTTLLHSVTFRLNVHVSFVDMSSRTERISTVSIPVVILAPPAPLPEVEPSLDVAYQKKHDRPPTKTVRHDDSAPHYYEGEAGPSAIHGAPPPFEERDAPPPFFSSAAEASTSSRLPTFLESADSDILVPQHDDESGVHPSHPSPTIVGEGIQFGFSPSEQFDGHSEDMQRSSTPPPTLEMATRDANLTVLADISEPEHAIEALGLVLDQHEEATREVAPPPPPAMDDPSDPPPSIDSDFRSPAPLPQSSQPLRPSPPPSRPIYPATDSPELPPGLHVAPPAPATQPQPSHGHAPPPYLVPEHEVEQEHVARPPPYVDLVGQH